VSEGVVVQIIAVCACTLLTAHATTTMARRPARNVCIGIIICQSRVSTNVGCRRSPPSRRTCVTCAHCAARTERGVPDKRSPRQSRLSALLTTPSDALSDDDTQDDVGGDRDRVCHRPHHRHPTLGIEVSTACMPHPNFPRKKVQLHEKFPW
jgi:hypothetical protein